MIFDTDVLIWMQRGNARALAAIEGDPERAVATWTYLELLQGAANRRQQATVLGYLRDFGFAILPLGEAIGRRAVGLIELHALSQGLGAGDALIAATAAEHGLVLCTGNTKHFKGIAGLKIKPFRPQ